RHEDQAAHTGACSAGARAVPVGPGLVSLVSAKVEFAVIGAGVIGLATTLALRDADVEAVCFEAGRPGHGQSTGETRGFRNRHDDDRLIMLAAAARQGWLEWEARSSRELLGREGVLRF